MVPHKRFSSAAPASAPAETLGEATMRANTDKKSSVTVSKDKNTSKSPRAENILPVLAHADELVGLASKTTLGPHVVIVVQGETGSGKTTQIPQILLDRVPGVSRIAVTQPRRVAATTIAARVASERSDTTREVGHRVRFDDFTTNDTKLIFMTDGMLLRESLNDGVLSKYDAVVLDEAHERSLSTDVLFGVVKRALTLRKRRLVLVVMSATLQVQSFLSFFPGAHFLAVKGRQFPVELFYVPEPVPDRVEACVVAALQIDRDEPLPGDILIFLSGREEIEACVSLLIKHGPGKSRIRVTPLLASLTPAAQLRAFAPTPKGLRKIIVATNVAETSVTVPGVRYVIDAGVVKSRTFKATTGIGSLGVVPISQAQAKQRMGRAGREAPGKCYRLYTEPHFESLSEETVPEMLRVSLCEVVMQLLAIGISNIKDFAFLDKPDPTAFALALKELDALGAVESVPNGGGVRLTPLGRAMSRIPVEPVYASLLLRARAMGLSKEIAGIVAVVHAAGESVFERANIAGGGESSKQRADGGSLVHPSGDHLTGLTILDAFDEIQAAIKVPTESPTKYEGEGEVDEESNESAATLRAWCAEHNVRVRALAHASKIRQQLVEVLADCPALPPGTFVTSAGQNASALDAASLSECILQCLAAGLATRCARKSGKAYVLVSKQGMRDQEARGKSDASKEFLLHPSCTLFTRKVRPDWVVFDEVLVTSKAFLRGVSAVKPSWLANGAPKLFQSFVAGEPQPAPPTPQEQAKKKRRTLMLDGDTF